MQPHFLGFMFRADRLYPWMVFAALSVCFATLTVVPWPFFNLNGVFPAFGLMAVFAWAMLRPDLCGFGSVFMLGLWQDFLLNLPLGVHSLFYMAVVFALRPARHFVIAYGFSYIYGAFFLTATLYGLYLALMAALFGLGGVGLSVWLIRLMLSALIFPCLFWVMMMAYRFIVLALKLR